MLPLRAVAHSCLVALLVTGCGSTAPEDQRDDGGLDVRLTHVPRFAEVPVVDGVVRASCQVTLEAIRRTDLPVGWSYLRVVYYVDSDRQTPFDSLTIAGDSVAGMWDGPVTPGNTPTSTWTFATRRPYYARGWFRYRWGSVQQDTPDFNFACIPDRGSSSAAPSIANLSVVPGDTLDPGTSLFVSYRLEAPAGSWQESIRVTGACDTVVQQSTPLERAADRTIVIDLPVWECRLGNALAVEVEATDARNRTARVPATARPFFTDRRPPTLSAITPIRGEFSLGLDLLPSLQVEDNVRLSRLVYVVEPFGVRDSVNLFGTGGRTSLRIPVRSDWQGVGTVKIVIRDSAGFISDTLRSVADSVWFFPWRSRPNASAQPGYVRTTVFDPKRERVYLLVQPVPNLPGMRVSVRSSITFDEIASYPVQDNVTGMDITPSGDSLLVVAGSSLTLGIIDLTAGSPVNQTSVLSHPALTAGPTYKVIAGAHGKAYVGYSFALVEVNLLNLQLRQIRGPFSSELGRSPDGSVISVIDGRTVNLMHAGDSTFFASRTVPGNTTIPLSFNQGATLISIGLALHGPSLDYQRTLFATGESAPREDVQLSPDGSRAVYLDQGPNTVGLSGIVVKDIATGRAIERIPIPLRFGNIRFRFSPDGTRLAVWDISNVAAVLLINLAG